MVALEKKVEGVWSIRAQNIHKDILYIFLILKILDPARPKKGFLAIIKKINKQNTSKSNNFYKICNIRKRTKINFTEKVHFTDPYYFC